MQSPSGRWPVLPKYLLRCPDGRYRSLESAVADFVTRAPSGCKRTNLANACGLLVDELDVITDRLVASGKIERNVSGDDETLFTSSHDDCFWGARA